MTPFRNTGALLLIGLMLAAGPASAQLPAGAGLGGAGMAGGGLPGTGLPADITPPDLGGRVSGALDQADGLAGRLSDLTGQRTQALRDLIRKNPKEIDVDEQGAPVVRGEILAVAPTPDSLARAQAAGFTVLKRESLEGDGLDLVTLGPPRGLDARRAVKRLRAADPAGDYDYNHIYSGAGSAPAAATAGATTTGGGPGAGAGLRIGLIDSGVDAGHPALVGARIEQRAFAPGGIKPAAHGTAAASLLAGWSSGVHGAAPGATLLVADVYGTGPTGGSAVSVARAMAWLEGTGVPVINISLVGPQNAAVHAMVRRLAARGVTLVAAVGNDGPAAPPLYPAAWPEVVAVTGVDPRGRVLPEACRGTHMDFAAPGSEISAARPGGGYAVVRGTSFAAPLVAGKLALLRRGRTSAQAIAALGAQVRDLGQKGPDRVYGRGLVAAELRIPPAARR